MQVKLIMGNPRMMSIEIFNDSSLQSNGDIILDNSKFQRVTKTKFLGAMINKNLTWKTMSRNTGVIN